MQYSLPVILDYDGRKCLATMGPFERSLERDFSLAVNKKAIEECDDPVRLKEVATNLLMGWSNMQGAIGSLVKENMQLRHAMAVQDSDLRAAEQLLNEVATNLLMGWSNMQGAIGSLVKENMQLRHAMAVQDSDLRAAEQLLNEVVANADHQSGSGLSSRPRQASRPNWNLWPWQM